MRQERRVEAALLRRDHHPARRLVPAERSAVLRIVLRHEVERHAEVFAPAVELERVIRAARLGPRAQRYAARARHDVLEIERFQNQFDAVTPHDILQLRPAEIGPWRRQAVITRELDHRIGMILSLDALTSLAKRELEQLRYPAPNWVLPRDGLTDVVVVGGGMCVTLGNGEIIHTRKAILAMGREGSGALRWPQFATFDPARRIPGVFHSADDLDFTQFKNRTIGILGAGASAFDNAAEALEAGAAQVVMFARRPILPQVNKAKRTAFPGFLHGYSCLADARSGGSFTYI